MSAIGEFLREIMPSWLSPQTQDRRADLREARDIADMKESREIAEEDARALAREADEVWQHCVDDGLHGEAFPEQAPEKTWRPAAGSEAREKPSRSNGPH